MPAMPEPAETKFARAPDGAHLAYQAIGEGPIDVLELPGTLMSIDAATDQPIWLRFLERMGSFCRLIRVDLRGIGLSDPIDASTPPTVERWMADALTVLDAAGSERTALWGVGFGGTIALLLAASQRPWATRTKLSPVRWSTRAGAWMAGSVCRRSTVMSVRYTAAAVAGLAPRLPVRRHHARNSRSRARLGAIRSTSSAIGSRAGSMRLS